MNRPEEEPIEVILKKMSKNFTNAAITSLADTPNPHVLTAIFVKTAKFFDILATDFTITKKEKA